MDSEDITELVRRVRTGDQSAWNAIVDKYTRLVWSVVRRFRLSEAEASDAAQTTWLRLVEHLDTIQNPACLPGWLQTTARRTCLAQLRSSDRELPVDPYEDTRLHRTADDAASPVSETLRNEEVALVRAALATLGERDRRLLTLLTSSEEVSYREISARLDLPIGSIGPTRARALGRLRCALAEVGVTEAAR